MSDKIKVLICEDNMLMQKVLEKALLHINFEIISVADGEQGIERIKGGDIGLIITDINMPYNNGLEIIQYVRKHYEKKIPVIVVTNILIEDTRKQAVELGADAFITKPFDPARLLTTIKELGILP